MYSIIIWRASTGEIIRQLRGHTGPVWKVCLSYDDCYLWSEDGYSSTRVYEVSTGKCVSLEKPPWALSTREGGISADNRFKYSYKNDKEGRRIEIVGLKEVKGEKGGEEKNNSAEEVCFLR